MTRFVQIACLLFAFGFMGCGSHMETTEAPPMVDTTPPDVLFEVWQIRRDFAQFRVSFDEPGYFTMSVRGPMRDGTDRREFGEPTDRFVSGFFYADAVGLLAGEKYRVELWLADIAGNSVELIDEFTTPP